MGIIANGLRAALAMAFQKDVVQFLGVTEELP
jgi:hypothetical protein